MPCPGSQDHTQDRSTRICACPVGAAAVEPFSSRLLLQPPRRPHPSGNIMGWGVEPSFSQRWRGRQKVAVKAALVLLVCLMRGLIILIIIIILDWFNITSTTDKTIIS